MKTKPKSKRGKSVGKDAKFQGNAAHPLAHAWYGTLNPDAVKLAGDLKLLAATRKAVEAMPDASERNRAFQVLAMAPTNGSTIPNNAPVKLRLSKSLVTYAVAQFMDAAERGDAKFFRDIGNAIEAGLGRQSPVDPLRSALTAYKHESRPTQGVSRDEVSDYLKRMFPKFSFDVSNMAKAAKAMGFTFRDKGWPVQPPL